MQTLGNPQDQIKVVHIAGTSGKTSTAYYIAALLRASGQKVGLTVSPHVYEINERIQINGEPLSEKEFCQALSQFADLVESLGIEVSRFEFMIAMAYWYFAKAGVNYAVVEVGLGGLKDGTNLVTRQDKVAVITDIGKDHTEILGATLPEIAGQKIGIVQPANVVFTYRQTAEIMSVYQTWCDGHKADLHIIEPAKTQDYRLRNWQLAHKVFEYISDRDGLPLPDQHSQRLTQDTPIPGRLEERWLNGKAVILDGAHNVQKMAALAKSFEHLYPDERPAVLIAIKEGKQYLGIAEIIRSLASRIIVTSFQGDQDMPVRSMDAGELASVLGGKVIPDQTQALQSLLSGRESVCLITGSFYLIGQIRNNKLLG